MPSTNRQRQRPTNTQQSQINRLLLDYTAPIASTIKNRPIPKKVRLAAVVGLVVIVAATLILLGTRPSASGSGAQATLNRLIGKDATASWNNGDVLVWATYGPTSNPTKKDVQTRAYEIQRAIWTSSLHPTSVSIGFYDEVPARSGGSQRSYIGMCTLNAATAKKLDWDHLTAAEAWNAYNIEDVYTAS